MNAFVRREDLMQKTINMEFNKIDVAAIVARNRVPQNNQDQSNRNSNWQNQGNRTHDSQSKDHGSKSYRAFKEGVL